MVGETVELKCILAKQRYSSVFPGQQLIKVEIYHTVAYSVYSIMKLYCRVLVLLESYQMSSVKKCYVATQCVGE